MKRVAIYARVSTTDQHLDGQVERLRAWAQGHGHEVVAEITDHGLSGADGKRPGLTRLLKMATAREVDIVAAASLDRLGRSLPDLLRIIGELKALDVQLYLAREGFDTSTPAGEMFLQMVGAFAQFERSILIERVKAGMERAAARGKHLGRPSKLTEDRRQLIERLQQEGTSRKDIAKLLGVSRSTLYRWLE